MKYDDIFLLNKLNFPKIIEKTHIIFFFLHDRANNADKMQKEHSFQEETLFKNLLIFLTFCYKRINDVTVIQ